MKFPSLIRLPRNKRFNFEPRFYDPVKEDIENRIAQIKSEMNQGGDEEFRSTLSGSFQRNRKTGSNASPAVLQLIIFTVLLGGSVGWLFYGNIALYAISTLIPLYLFLRIRKVI